MPARYFLGQTREDIDLPPRDGRRRERGCARGGGRLSESPADGGAAGEAPSTTTQSTSQETPSRPGRKPVHWPYAPKSPPNGSALVGAERSSRCVLTASVSGRDGRDVVGRDFVPEVVDESHVDEPFGSFCLAYHRGSFGTG
jgi:hypothetical protein